MKTKTKSNKNCSMLESRFAKPSTSNINQKEKGSSMNKKT